MCLYKTAYFYSSQKSKYFDIFIYYVLSLSVRFFDAINIQRERQGSSKSTGDKEDDECSVVRHFLLCLDVCDILTNSFTKTFSIFCVVFN